MDRTRFKGFRAIRRNDMMSDDDSCDSGVCDMDYQSMPTCFSAAMRQERNEKIMLQTLDLSMDGMEIDTDENEFCKELMKLPETAPPPPPPSRRQPFGDASNRMNNRKNSCVKLYDESPKSRTLFVRPAPVMKPMNAISRKRTFAGFQEPSKRVRQSFDEDLTAPSTSKALPFSLKQSGPVVLHRAHSSSILERGENFTRHHKDDGELPQVLEVSYHLKAISPACSNAFRRISETTLYELLSSMSDDEFLSKYVLIDCRYPFEYNGGHIRNAINLYDPAECEAMFYKPNGTKKDKRTPIFYCEYSQKRGPSMAYTLRRIDRQHNELLYPHCDYQEMYVLDKGFRNFYSFTREERISEMCQPDNYVTMDDQRFASELRKWNFHKKSAIGTSVRVVDVRSRVMLRQMDSETLSASRTSSRRLLFENNSSPTSFGLEVVHEVRTPSPNFDKPLVQPRFS